MYETELLKLDLPQWSLKAAQSLQEVEPKLARGNVFNNDAMQGRMLERHLVATSPGEEQEHAIRNTKHKNHMQSWNFEISVTTGKSDQNVNPSDKDQTIL